MYQVHCLPPCWCSLSLKGLVGSDSLPEVTLRQGVASTLLLEEKGKVAGPPTSGRRPSPLTNGHVSDDRCATSLLVQESVACTLHAGPREKGPETWPSRWWVSRPARWPHGGRGGLRGGTGCMQAITPGPWTPRQDLPPLFFMPMESGAGYSDRTCTRNSRSPREAQP